MFKATNKGANESGFEMPRKELNSFTKSPASIIKAMLNPNDMRTVSRRSSLLIFSSLMIMNPGRKVR